MSQIIDLIQTDTELATACEAWRGQAMIGVDTEFERTRTYFARPGLVQICVADSVYLLDPISIDDWSPFAALLLAPHIQIVMHACGEDIALLARLTGVTPSNLFDTQIAAAMISLEANASYQKLVKSTLDEDIDKSESRSDWLRRPLSLAQLEYAASDVRHLEALRNTLHPTLSGLGRLDWVFEEGARLIAGAMCNQGLRHYERTVTRLDLEPPQQEFLKRLCIGRETIAEQRDVPRRRVLEDDVLTIAASSINPNVDALPCFAQLVPGLSARQAKTLELCLGQCQSVPPVGPALGKQNAARFMSLLKRLKDKVRQKAKSLQIAPERIASKRMLESLIAHRLHHLSQIPEVFSGWRRRTITDELIQVIDRYLEETHACGHSTQL